MIDRLKLGDGARRDKPVWTSRTLRAPRTRVANHRNMSRDNKKEHTCQQSYYVGVDL